MQFVNIVDVSSFYRSIASKRGTSQNILQVKDLRHILARPAASPASSTRSRGISRIVGLARQRDWILSLRK